MRMFDVCVEMPSTSKNYHGFFSGQIFQACGYHISLDQKCFSFNIHFMESKSTERFVVLNPAVTFGIT